MTLVIGLAAGLWGVGWLMGAPHRLRWGMIAALWFAVVLVNATLPPESPLRVATGGDARVWIVFAAAFLVVMGYRAGLRRLRAGRVVAPVASAAFSDSELDRYARHIMLREIGGPGQRRLKDARVLVVGAGGLGSPAILYLAAAGVGTIGVIDDDTVEGSNLQRQIIHTDQRIGMPKVQSALTAVRALNPFVTLRPYHRRLTEDIAVDLVAEYDLVLDGSDNFDTRYLVNRACVTAGKPLISAAMTQWEGQISLYHPTQGAPCYACIFPVRPAAGMVPSCAEAGVVAPLPGVIGSMMALEAVKHLTQAGETLAKRLLIHDALYNETRVIKLAPRLDCEVCGSAQH